jgi:hypothetical protein
MIYSNTETKLDALIGYFNEKKINLSPIFQRGRVWQPMMRQELIKNIIRKRPIPAIFLYKDAVGSKYSYNILDGKQRLESILMFIGSGNQELKINTTDDYIADRQHRKTVGFKVDMKDGKGKRCFADFSDDEIRELREYSIPTIEINLDENTTLDEIISLFVDINQYGERVTRRHIVKAIKYSDPLIKDIYALIAQSQTKKSDVFVKKKASAFVSVLKKLTIVASVSDRSAQADRMWEKLLELALFVRSGGTHRKPSEILKTFIKNAEDKDAKLSKDERRKLTNVFKFLAEAYKKPDLVSSRLATDQTHFYIMTTALLSSDLLTTFSSAQLTRKFIAFSRLIAEDVDDETDPNIKNYMELSEKQTTDAKKRKERHRLFIVSIQSL